jgi:hypothetical protein
MAEANDAAGTAPHSIRRIDNNPEKAPHAWPAAFEILDAFGRRARADSRFCSYFGFNADRDGSEAETRALEYAQEARKRADWYAALPRGVRSNGFLETARTIRSRALDALGYVERGSNGLPRNSRYTVEELDIIADLEAVVSRLEAWKRTGRTPKYNNPKEVSK